MIKTSPSAKICLGEPMTIGKAARSLGIHVETIRYYERRGLIEKPTEKRGAFRVYPPETLVRLRNIKHAQSLGFSLEEIKTLLDIGLDQLPQRKDVHAMIQQRLDEMENSVEALRTMKRFVQFLEKAGFSESERWNGNRMACVLECCLGESE